VSPVNIQIRGPEVSNWVQGYLLEYLSVHIPETVVSWRVKPAKEWRVDIKASGTAKSEDVAALAAKVKETVEKLGLQGEHA